MIEMNADCPNFRSDFMAAVSNAFISRRKAYSYHGDVDYEFGDEERPEWFALHYRSYSYPMISLQIVQDYRINLCIRSNKRKDRGKILFKLEGELVEELVAHLVEAFEKTIIISSKLQTPGEVSLANRKLATVWGFIQKE